MKKKEKKKKLKNNKKMEWDFCEFFIFPVFPSDNRVTPDDPTKPKILLFFHTYNHILLNTFHLYACNYVQ